MTNVITKKIGVISGGWSSERPVSLRSGKNISDSLRRQGYQVEDVDLATDGLTSWNFDIAFIALHGEFGEDGYIQSLLESRNIPYIGSGSTASLIANNKLLTKQVISQHGILTPQFRVIRQLEDCFDISRPMILKPINQGSSIDIEYVENTTDLKKVAKRLLSTYSTLLCEEFIDGQEVTVSLLKLGHHYKKLPILELRTNNTFYDYDAKYTPGKTEFIIPAELEEPVADNCQDIARSVFEIIGCKSVSRVDMIVKDNTPYVLEINTIPGMTALSDLPAQANAAGISFDELTSLLLQTI